jgi:phosphohistidine phosphatase
MVVILHGCCYDVIVRLGQFEGFAMKTLFLLRHAKSSWDDPTLPDFDRPLAKRGKESCDRLRAFFARQRFRPDLVLCSGAKRALQTWKGIAPALPITTAVLLEDGLYLAGVEKLLARLRALDDRHASAMVVGHNPDIETLTVELAGEGDAFQLARIRTKFPTGALAMLSADIERWAELAPHRARLEAFIRPADLRGDPEAEPSLRRPPRT